MISTPANILICRSNPVAPDPRVEKEAAVLTEAGHRVSVIGWDRSTSFPINEKKGQYEIYRIPIPAKYGMGMGNLIKLLSWQARLSLWLYIHRGEVDILHACDFDTVLPCLLMKLIFGKKLIYDIFDFYPDHLRNTPLWIKQAIRKLDYWIITRADAIILVDDSRREQIKETTPLRLSVIYNSPEDNNPLKKNSESPLRNNIKLAYVGLLQKERGLLEILSIMEKHPQWTLDVAGFGGDEEVIHAVCKGLPNVNWHGTVQYKDALELSSQADILFATYDPTIPNHRYSSPNKLFEAMMLGKPIIVCHNTNMDMIVSQHNCGIVVAYGNELELENALLRLANDPALCASLGNNARKAYETYYSWNIMKSRLIELYSQI